MVLDDIKNETFFTPEELAERLKLSTATIYKLIGNDELPYFKVGKCYRIPSRALASYIMKAGNISHFIPSAPKTPDAARFFIEKIAETPELENTVVGVVLFGSYARGDYDDNSDIDLLVLLKQNSPQIEEEIASISSEAMEDCNFDQFLSPIRMSLAHWNELATNGSPLHEEIQREGIVLWPKESKSLRVIEHEHARN